MSGFFDRTTSRFLAVASGAFSLVVIVGLLWYALRFHPGTWLADERTAPQRDAIRRGEGQVGLVESFRSEDVLRRKEFFNAERKTNIGAYLLFVSLFVFAMSMRRLSALGARLPLPQRRGGEVKVERERNRSLVSVLAVSTAGVALCLLAVCWAQQQPVQKEGGARGPLVAEEAPAKSVPDHLKWPAFRGAGGQGIAAEMKLPISWDAEKGANLLWKTKVPLPGHSSPIIWDDKIFLTGADLKTRCVYCFDRADGRLLWTCTIKTQVVLPEDFEVYEDTGLAAPSPVTDGKRVYAFFGTAEMAAVDFTGKQVWTVWFGPPDSGYGLSSSPVLWDGKLILQLDQDGRAKGKSFLYAIDPADGKTIWKTPRDAPASWSTPIVIKTDKDEEIITCSDPFVISYEAKSGKEVWRAKVLATDIAPLPVYADGMVYTANDNAQLSAIRVGGTGDVTKTHVAWTYEQGMPDVSSPLTDGKLLIMAASGYGAVTCMDAKSGKRLWKQEFDDMFWSSPTLVGRQVYLTDMKGKTHIFELAGAYKLLGMGTVGEKVITSPAFADSNIYIRGVEHLFAIGAKEP